MWSPHEKYRTQDRLGKYETACCGRVTYAKNRRHGRFNRRPLAPAPAARGPPEQRAATWRLRGLLVGSVGPGGPIVPMTLQLSARRGRRGPASWVAAASRRSVARRGLARPAPGGEEFDWPIWRVTTRGKAGWSCRPHSSSGHRNRVAPLAACCERPQILDLFTV